jgi:hypothetical protein
MSISCAIRSEGAAAEVEQSRVGHRRGTAFPYRGTAECQGPMDASKLTVVNWLGTTWRVWLFYDEQGERSVGTWTVNASEFTLTGETYGQSGRRARASVFGQRVAAL